MGAGLGRNVASPAAEEGAEAAQSHVTGISSTFMLTLPRSPFELPCSGTQDLFQQLARFAARHAADSEFATFSFIALRRPRATSGPLSHPSHASRD